MLKLSSLLFFFLLGCNSLRPDLIMHDVTFDPYVKKFEENCNVVSTVPVMFKELPEGVLGACRNKIVVVINPNYWHHVSEDEREFLIFHELGHCVLDRRHDNTILLNLNGYINMPRSMMYEHVFGYADGYKQNKEYYWRELCQK